MGSFKDAWRARPHRPNSFHALNLSFWVLVAAVIIYGLAQYWGKEPHWMVWLLSSALVLTLAFIGLFALVWARNPPPAGPSDGATS